VDNDEIRGTVVSLPSPVASRALNRTQLPANYEHAVIALRECAAIDECADWAEKAKALASYARQAEDQELRILAERIRARATRRIGELLREIEPLPGTRTDLEPREGGHPRLTRGQAAAEAGLSEWQRKIALRVANIPEDEFEEAVESNEPLTVTALAERGTRAIAIPVRYVMDPASEIRLVPERLVPIATVREVDTVITHKEIRSAALREAVAELQRTRERFDYLGELAPVWASLDERIGAPPSSNEGSIEGQVRALMTAWREAAPEAQYQFLERVRGGAAARDEG
jgi:hypothetical protein